VTVQPVTRMFEKSFSPLSIFCLLSDYRTKEHELRFPIYRKREPERVIANYRKQGEEVMPQYLVASYLPDDFDPSTVTEAMVEEIHKLNRELIAAGVRKFACGVTPARDAKTVRRQPDGTVLVTDGPYTETKEHLGGFWILEAANMDEALAWARKGAISCDAVGEVRELLFYPAPEQEPGGRK
jgi:hypothetical protein